MPTAAGLYYFVHGEDLEDRPPVLLIHGAGGSHASWPPQLRRLSGQRVFAPDLPGHGKSSGLGSQEVDEYARAAVEFMKAVRLSSAVIVGFSMGSAIALSLALRYRKRALALVLIGSGAKMRVAESTLELASNPSMFLPAVETIVENSYSSNVDPRVKELAIQQMAETRQAVLYSDFLACDAFNAMEKVNRIQVPTLLITGSADRMTPPNRAQYLQSQIEGAELEIVEAAGHMVIVEQPDVVAGLLLDFLDRVPYPVNLA
jgi:pimeloyl-ACP methyl ester carboxylesterase